MKSIRWLVAALGAVCLLVSTASTVSAEELPPSPPTNLRALCSDCTFAWDPNTGPNLAGYKFYWGPDSGDLTNIVDVGNVTAYTATDLTGTVYAAVTAYDFDGRESGFSNEVMVSFSVPDAVTLTVKGQIKYSNTGPLTSGNIAVSPIGSGPVTSVTGSGTIPGIGGDATVSFSVRRFWITNLHTGSVTFSDPGTGITLRTPVLFARVSRLGDNTVASSSSWLSTASFPWKTYTLRWTVEDGG